MDILDHQSLLSDQLVSLFSLSGLHTVFENFSDQDHLFI